MNSIGAYVIWDKEKSKIIGSSRFNQIPERKDIVEIGWSFLAYEFWGKGYNFAFKKLMVDYGLKTFNDILFYVDVNNIISQKAMEKLGAGKIDIEGTDYYPQKKGRNDIYIYYLNKMNWKY